MNKQAQKVVNQLEHARATIANACLKIGLYTEENELDIDPFRPIVDKLNTVTDVLTEVRDTFENEAKEATPQ